MEVCADSLQNTKMNIQRLKDHYDLLSMRRCGEPWRFASQLSGAISSWQLASTEKGSRFTRKQKPTGAPAVSGPLEQRI
jgi:hypothetical protein